MDIGKANQIVQQKWNAMEVTNSKRNFSFGLDRGQDNNNSNIIQGPSLTELRKKFLELDDNSNSITSSPIHGGSEDMTDDVDVKLIKSKNADGDDVSFSKKERTVIISPLKGLTGAQG